MAKKEAVRLVGLKVLVVRAMTREEVEDEGWSIGRHGVPAVLELEGGVRLYAAQDEEGNGPGALFGKRGEMPFIVTGGSKEG